MFISGGAVGITAIVAVLWCATAFSADTKQVIAPTAGLSAWPANIKAHFDAIRALPGTPKEPVIAAIKKFAKNGTAARPALVALASDTALPEPHRAMSGIMSAHFIRYDVSALRAMAEADKNPFARREAIELLADVGGRQIRDFLGGLGKSDATLSAYINKVLPRVPATEAVSEDNRRMLANILLQPAKGKLSAAVSIALLNEGKTTVDTWLEALAVSPVADDDTQMHAALALVKIHKDSVPDLKALCARGKHRFVRYNAIQELSRKGAAGDAVLRELLVTPDEPLRKQIEARLAKK